mgnify:CR=1 FL=1
MSKWTRLDSKCPGLWKSDKKKMTVVFLVIDWRTGMDFTKSKVSLKNWVSKNVRVANIQATIVLRCSNEPDLKADSKSVRISEISQQMPEIATFLFQKGGKKAENFFRFLDFGAKSFEYRERKREEILSAQSLALGILTFSVNGQMAVKFYQLFANSLRWSLENLKKMIVRLTFERGRKEEKSLTNKQTRKILKSKGNSLTNKQTNLKIWVISSKSKSNSTNFLPRY